MVADPVVRLLKSPETRSALVVAHPGHEGRVYQWIRSSKPATYLMTTGSRAGCDLTRLAGSDMLVASTGARCISGWGRMLDTDFYKCMLRANAAPLLALVESLAASFAADDIQLVVTDAWQGYNVAHDICHLIARLAAQRASTQTGRPVECLVYPVVPSAMATQALGAERLFELVLTEPEVREKIRQVRTVPEIAGEIDELTRIEGVDAFRIESFWRPFSLSRTCAPMGRAPFYESHGKARVRDGTYKTAIRWEHTRAMITALEPSLTAESLATRS